METDPEDTNAKDLDIQLSLVDKDLKNVEEDLHRLQDKKERLKAKKQRLLDLKDQKVFQKISEKNWEATDFPWSSKLNGILRDTFKMKTFRPLQLSAVNAFLSGHDILVIMPTGGGKSLCYQLSALAADKGLTLIVSPLVSLMEDQMMALNRLNINAAMLNASSTKEEVNKVFADMIDPKSDMRLLYVTPEKLAKSKRFMAKLQKSYSEGVFSKLAIDEVHCCSQWGHDFRPDYKFLGVVRSLFPKVPILGLTATCTAQVTEDIKKILHLGQKCLIFKSPLNRKNLFYEVRQKPESLESCIDEFDDLLRSEFDGQSGIIYTLTIKDAEAITNGLRSKGLKVGCYHANLEAAYRSKVHKKWTSGEYQAVVATIAFGMGIDKADVRFVIHHSMSKSMENFYQESGRAGRDDKPAKCILFYRFADIFRLSTMVFTEQTGLEKLYAMVAYALDLTRCRRKMISDHFGERWDSTDCNKMCDICSNKNIESSKMDITTSGNAVIEILTRAMATKQKVTAIKLIEALRGRGAATLKLPDWKPSKEISADKNLAENLVAFLLMEGYIKEDFHFTPYNTISYLEPGNRSLRSPTLMTVEGSTSSKKRDKSPEKGPAKKKSKIEDDESGDEDDIVELSE